MTAKAFERRGNKSIGRICRTYRIACRCKCSRVILEEVYVGDCFEGGDADPGTGDELDVGNGSVLLVISVLLTCGVSEMRRTV